MNSYAATKIIPRYNLSEFGQHDVSQQLPYFSVSQDALPVPGFKTELQDWLAQLVPHHSTNTFGDSFLTVFEVYNDQQNSDWFVYPYGSVVEHIEIHSYDNSRENQWRESVLSGHSVLNQQDFHYGAQVEIKPGQSKTIVMVFRSDYFFAPIKILMQPLPGLQQQFNQENVVMLLSLGICFALALYNIFIFFVVRQYQYLNYALATLAYACGWASVFGVPEYMGLGSSTMLLMPSYVIGALFSSYFYKQFLRCKLRSPRINTAFNVIAICCVISLPLAFYQQGFGLYIASLLTSAVLFFGLYSGISEWRAGYQPARYFTCALVAVLLPNMVGNMMNLGILPAINVNIYLLGLVGNSVDSLLLAFALAAQVRLVNLENIKLNNRLEQTVEERTVALRQSNLQLEQTNSELLEASLAKGRFLATMSHEIRTPLTSIIGYADGILMGDIDKAEQERVTKIIAENGKHLLAVINDILDLSKIEANKLDFECIPTPLFAILAQIESVVGKRARDKGLAFHLDYQYPLPAQIDTDPTRLKQILFNLTNNAIKFTEHGFVGLSVRIQDGRLVISVKDSGEGLSPQQMQRLFEPFTQADNSINRRFGGTGLGLSISQRLAQGLEGEITVDSTPRKGSVFSVVLPFKVSDGSAWINSVGEIWQSTPSQSVKPMTLPNFAGNRVLLADDHPANRELISLLLKRMNISVTEVDNGQRVLDTLFFQKFDLLLLDIHMPTLDGVEALKQIRASGNSTPVIALTANNMKHEVQHYLRMGFSDHLAKPISREHFIAKLTKYLTKQGTVESPVLQSDMLRLIYDYQQDLRLQVDKLERAWQIRDISLISELAHRISGSAASFGFDLLSQRFRAVEQSALQDDEIALTYELPKVLKLSQQCIALPEVNIPLGIVRHRNSVEQFLYALYELTAQSPQIISDLQQAIENQQINSALVFLHELQPGFERCGMQNAEQFCKQLEQQFTAGDWQLSECLAILQQMNQQIAQLNHALSPNVLCEF